LSDIAELVLAIGGLVKLGTTPAQARVFGGDPGGYGVGGYGRGSGVGHGGGYGGYPAPPVCIGGSGGYSGFSGGNGRFGGCHTWGWQ
jgi:hypothetical protein